MFPERAPSGSVRMRTDISLTSSSACGTLQRQPLAGDNSWIYMDRQRPSPCTVTVKLINAAGTSAPVTYTFI